MAEPNDSKTERLPSVTERLPAVSQDDAQPAAQATAPQAAAAKPAPQQEPLHWWQLFKRLQVLVDKTGLAKPEKKSEPAKKDGHTSNPSSEVLAIIDNNAMAFALEKLNAGEKSKEDPGKVRDAIIAWADRANLDKRARSEFEKVTNNWIGEARHSMPEAMGIVDDAGTKALSIGVDTFKDTIGRAHMGKISGDLKWEARQDDEKHDKSLLTRIPKWWNKKEEKNAESSKSPTKPIELADNALYHLEYDSGDNTYRLVNDSNLKAAPQEVDSTFEVKGDGFSRILNPYANVSIINKNPDRIIIEKPGEPSTYFAKRSEALQKAAQLYEKRNVPSSLPAQADDNMERLPPVTPSQTAPVNDRIDMARPSAERAPSPGPKFRR